MKRTNKKYRIRSKFRFVTFLVIIVGLTFGAVGYFTGIDFSTALAKPGSDIQIEVGHGETLWDIAYEFKSSDKDVRKAVYELAKVNDIDDGEIAEGQTLIIPESL